MWYVTPVALERSLAITLIFISLSITFIIPPDLEPTKIFPALLSAICRGVSIFSTNISMEKPSLTCKFFIMLAESEFPFIAKDKITNRFKKNL